MKAIDAVLFDLDDTLYEEMNFVTAALERVARFLAARAFPSADQFLAEMLDILETVGRGRVFDIVLERHGLPSSWVRPLLYVYRSADPELALFSDALPLLDDLRRRHVRTGIVTDGSALVQANKVRGLGLNQLVDVVVYTDTLDEGAAKPAPTGFLVALELLGSEPAVSAYVANDVRKDFAGPRSLDMTGVLVTRRMLGDLDSQPRDAHPDHIVADLSEVGVALGIATGVTLD